jgi:hypothetical protein
MQNEIACLIVRLCLAALCSAQGMAMAQDAKSTSTGPSVVEGVRIELVAQPKEVELPSQFNIAFRLVNATSEAVVFRNFDLKPLEEPGGLKVAEDCLKQVQTTIGANGTRLIICQMHSESFKDSLSSFMESLFSSWSLVTLQPGDYRFVAKAEYRKSDLSTSTCNTIITLKIRPTIWQVCFGAAFGALLLVLFAFSSPRIRKLMASRDRLENATWFERWVIEPVALWVGASVASSIFIFLTYRLKDVSGPFTITVNDFYGGVVLGLFGVFLADWLAGKLFVANAKVSPSGNAT